VEPMGLGGNCRRLNSSGALPTFARLRGWGEGLSCRVLGGHEARVRSDLASEATLRKQDDSKCLGKNDAIQPGSPVADIPPFELDSIFQSQLISAAHLPETRHARAGRKNCAQVVADATAFVREIGTRSYQTHFSFKNVEQLRELVQAPPPKEAAQLRKPRIVLP